MRALSVAAAAHPRPAVPRARCLTGQILLAASTRRHPPLGRKAVCGRRIAQAVGVARLRREREARGQARTRGSRRFALVWFRRAVAVWDNEALLGWYRSIDEAVRSKGALYLALHPDGDHAWGRWVGMSYNGVVVSGWGASPAPKDRPTRSSKTSSTRSGMTHRSRLAHFVIDVDDLDQGVDVLVRRAGREGGTSQRGQPPGLPPPSGPRLRGAHPAAAHRRPKTHKERMHLDLESDDVEAEVRRLEALGATRYDHQQERGYDFWVLRDPWANEFCVLQINFPDLLAQRPAWPDPVSRDT